MYCMPVFFQFFIYLFDLFFSFFYSIYFKFWSFSFLYRWPKIDASFFNRCSVLIFYFFFLVSTDFHITSETKSASKINWGWTLTWRSYKYDIYVWCGHDHGHHTNACSSNFQADVWRLIYRLFLRNIYENSKSNTQYSSNIHILFSVWSRDEKT